MAKQQILDRWMGKVLWEGEAEGVKEAVVIAVCAGAQLGGANLERANLAGANLEYANLERANLQYAHLERANLERANLAGANLAVADLTDADLTRASLAGAHLAGAYLAGAHLAGAHLAGLDPIICLGPLGSRAAYLTAYRTEAGLRIATGCFLGTAEEFAAQVNTSHGDNRHGRLYRAALEFLRVWEAETDE